MGRIFHKILTKKNAKFFGASYTKIPSSVLLLKLTFYYHNWNLDWTNAESIREIRISDLACGTGTLLKSG